MFSTRLILLGLLLLAVSAARAHTEEKYDFPIEEFEEMEEFSELEGGDYEFYDEGENDIPPPPYYQPPAYQAPAYPSPVYQPSSYQPPTYQTPAYPPPAHQVPTYQPAPPQQPPAYQAPAQPQPAYKPPAQSYQQPAQPAYQQPAQQAYQAPAKPAQAYQAPAQPAQAYQAPAQPAQTYQAPAQKAYQAPAQQTYQAPAQPAQQAYQQPAQQTYQAPAQPAYQAPAKPAQPAYQPPAQPAQSYQQPSQPAHQQQAPAKPAQQAYQPPAHQPQAQQPPAYKPVAQPAPAPAYKQPAQQQQQQQQQPSYRPATQHVPAVHANYSKPVVQSSNYTAARPAVPAKYSPTDLASIVPFTGYRANHWTLFYYRAAPYRTCPKNVYLNGPGLKDIEAAFDYAGKQIQVAYNGNNVNYMNSSQHSWPARHQIFSFLTQKNARMDEEGLMGELVSQYLSDRACLTKWDKQRYLPQMTKFLSVGQYPGSHSCNNLYRNPWQNNLKQCVQSKYRTFDGFCNNPYHPYWGKSNVCHIRLLSPDYADGISAPRSSYNGRYPLPNPRAISNYVHNEVPLDGPYNLMKMQWGQFINHDITNTALSAYDGLVDCCRNPGTRGCWPIPVPPGDRFYGQYNVTCLNFIRSGVCPTCQLGPRQQINKNTAFLDASHVYGQSQEQANQLRAFRGGELKTSQGRNGEILLPIAMDKSSEQCHGACFLAGDSRVNQHPALTALHTLLLRSHNMHARGLARRHPNWNDEQLFQEARRIVIAEYQMITYGEYLPIVFGPILSAYYHLIPNKSGYTQFEPKADPTTWNEYSTASCRFGHSQISSTFGLYSQIMAYAQHDNKLPTFRLKDWFMRPSFLNDGLLPQIINGMLSRSAGAVDPWVSNDVRNHLYQSHREMSGGDLVATNIWRGRDHGIPSYVHYVEYCFNHKVRNWKDLSMFIPYYSLNQLKKMYKAVENVDLFTGGLAERHFPGADTGPTFACINGIQYYHLKFGDRFYFEHGGQAGSFNPAQLEEIKRSTLARLLCRTARIQAAPQYAFLQPSQYNPLVNCSMVGEIDYGKF